MRVRVSREMLGCPLTARDTVLRPTPALRAMSCCVARRVTMTPDWKRKPELQTESPSGDLCYQIDIRCERGRKHAAVMILQRRLGLALGAILVLTGGMRADVRIAPLFGDGMVLQRNQQVRLWGKADP